MRPPESGYQLFFFFFLCYQNTMESERGYRKRNQEDSGLRSERTSFSLRPAASRAPLRAGLWGAPKPGLCSAPGRAVCAQFPLLLGSSRLSPPAPRGSIYNRARPEWRPHRKVSPNQRRWNGQRHRLICHPNFQPTLLVKPNLPWPALAKGSGECHGALPGWGSAAAALNTAQRMEELSPARPTAAEARLKPRPTCRAAAHP